LSSLLLANSCPVWIYGFLHYFAAFSQDPPLASCVLTELPQRRSVPTLPIVVDDLHVCPMQRSTSGDSHASSLVKLPTKRFSVLWRSSRPSSLTQPSFLHSTPVPLSLATLGVNPAREALWRKEEKKWALRCGYAFTVWWSIVLALLVVGLSSGMFGVRF